MTGNQACQRAPPALGREPPHLSRPIGDYLANLYVDTVCYHHEALACCYQVLGAEHLLFGTTIRSAKALRPSMLLPLIADGAAGLVGAALTSVTALSVSERRLA